MTGVLTALLVVITGFYAWATFRILRANEAVVKVMKDQLEAQGRPYVHPSLFVVPGTNFWPSYQERRQNGRERSAANYRQRLLLVRGKEGRSESPYHERIFSAHSEFSSECRNRVLVGARPGRICGKCRSNNCAANLFCARGVYVFGRNRQRKHDTRFWSLSKREHSSRQRCD